MAKKLKKDKRKMSPKTKNILVNSFKGIISNQACIDNGKEAPWWLAVIFAVVSVILPLIPNFVSLNNAYGSSFLANGSFGMDMNISKASVALKNEGKEFTVENGLLTYNKPVSEAPVYTSIDSNYNEYNFVMYYVDYEGDTLQNFINQIVEKEYVLNSTTVYDKTTDPEGLKDRYIPSFVILAKNTMAIAVYKSRTTTRAGNTPGGLNWSSTPNGTKLIADRALKDVTSTTEDAIARNREDWNKCYSNWKSVIDETYLIQKNATKWNTTLIYLGVYAGLLFFLGLMLFLLTRGKANPFSQILNFWHTQKISYFLSFTPAVLGMILGFVLAGNVFGQMGFILLMSLRAMWASMRSLRPVQ